MFFTVYDPLQLISYPSVTLRLGEGKRMEKRKEKIILSFPQFESLSMRENEEMERLFICLGV